MAGETSRVGWASGPPVIASRDHELGKIVLARCQNRRAGRPPYPRWMTSMLATGNLNRAHARQTLHSLAPPGRDGGISRHPERAPVPRETDRRLALREARRFVCGDERFAATVARPALGGVCGRDS